ncbi:MAG TPA: hypothetical protein PLL98_06740 [Bacillota bacterium]|nr:hypothetical protein [Bacillota bacterium]HPL52746.1 hypothetical protein [Bacillota bacterium]
MTLQNITLPTVLCAGTTKVEVNICGKTECKDLVFECLKVKKVFDEFVLRDCVEGIKFQVCGNPHKDTIEPALILRNCRLSNVEIKNVSTNTDKRLKFSAKCCCDVFGKDSRGNIIRLEVLDVPEGTNLSAGSSGELCFTFSVKRTYHNTTDENFERLVHFLDQGRFELQCLGEALIDEDNNTTTGEILVTNLGVFIAIKFDAEVQLCIPVLGYCSIEEDITPIEVNFCEEFEFEDVPSFNPPQLGVPTPPYTAT